LRRGVEGAARDEIIFLRQRHCLPHCNSNDTATKR
jgi:hypothetical protein